MEITSIWEGLKFTIIGVAIVFGVLAFLGFVLEMFKIIFYHPEKKGKEKEIKKKEVKEISPVLAPKREKEDKRSKLRKIAAIAAVLSMYEERKRRYMRSEGGGLNFWRVKEIVGRKVSSKIKTKRWKNG